MNSLDKRVENLLLSTIFITFGVCVFITFAIVLGPYIAAVLMILIILLFTGKI